MLSRALPFALMSIYVVWLCGERGLAAEIGSWTSGKATVSSGSNLEDLYNKILGSFSRYCGGSLEGEKNRSKFSRFLRPPEKLEKILDRFSTNVNEFENQFKEFTQYYAGDKYSVFQLGIGLGYFLICDNVTLGCILISHEKLAGDLTALNAAQLLLRQNSQHNCIESVVPLAPELIRAKLAFRTGDLGGRLFNQQAFWSTNTITLLDSRTADDFTSEARAKYQKSIARIKCRIMYTFKLANRNIIGSPKGKNFPIKSLSKDGRASITSNLFTPSQEDCNARDERIPLLIGDQAPQVLESEI